MPEWILIAARDRNGVIGVQGELPWHLPNDFKHFKNTTKGFPVLMGRKTFESIGRPLPGRRNVVLTRNAGFSAEGVETVDSIDAAERLVQDADRVFVIGGGELYRQWLPRADRIILTEVDTEVTRGDAWFPELDADRFEEVSRESYPADDRHSFPYAFVEYVPVG